MDRVCGPVGKARARLALLVVALLCCDSAVAETRVYLLRGWFGVFSTGMDSMAQELQRKGIKAEAIGHTAWKSTVARIVKDRAAGETGRLVLVGHSQGANNIVEMARELQAHRVSVDLLITLAPFLQDPVPPNVVRAVNYYQPGGWGSPLVAEGGFTGELVNIDVAAYADTFHVTIDKSAKIQAEVLGAIGSLSR